MDSQEMHKFLNTLDRIATALEKLTKKELVDIVDKGLSAKLEEDKDIDIFDKRFQEERKEAGRTTPLFRRKGPT